MGQRGAALLTVVFRSRETGSDVIGALMEMMNPTGPLKLAIIGIIFGLEVLYCSPPLIPDHLVREKRD